MSVCLLAYVEWVGEGGGERRRRRSKELSHSSRVEAGAAVGWKGSRSLVASVVGRLLPPGRNKERRKRGQRHGSVIKDIIR